MRRTLQEVFSEAGIEGLQKGGKNAAYVQDYISFDYTNIPRIT